MQILSDSGRTSWLTTIDPRARIVMALMLIFMTVLLTKVEVILLLVMAVCLLSVCAQAVSRLTLRRFRELNLFMLLLFVFVPLSTPGEVILSAGELTWSREGVLLAVVIAGKANAVMLICNLLLASMEPAVLAHALQRLRVPSKLVYILFFCIRYLEVIHVEYHRMYHAMKLRGFRPTWRLHALRSLGNFIGMLFVRSLDRSDRILEAMKCRGFHGRLFSLVEYRYKSADLYFIMAGSGVLIICLLFEWGGV